MDSRLKISGMTEGEDSRLNFRHDGTDNEGASPLITPGKDENTKRQRKKTKNNPEEKASVSSPLNGSIRGPRVSKPLDSHLLVTPAIFKPGSTVLKRFGFPIKNFGNDKKKSVTRRLSSRF
ncbi:MAG: hypothetical protein QM228_02240 [Atribacterota bacterium]|nr:hypothetical protein [Atribacterota bacterium]